MKQNTTTKKKKKDLSIVYLLKSSLQECLHSTIQHNIIPSLRF